MRLACHPAALFDFGFLEEGVLASYRIIFAHFHLFGLGARVLLGHVEIARALAGLELNDDGIGFGHDRSLDALVVEAGNIAFPAGLSSLRPLVMGLLGVDRALAGFGALAFVAAR